MISRETPFALFLHRAVNAPRGKGFQLMKVFNSPASLATLIIPIRIIWRQHPLDAAAPPFAGRRRRLTRLETMNCSRGRGSAPNILRVRGLTVRGYGFIE